MGRDRIIERERRWAVPAAILALAPLVLYIVSLVIVQGADLAGGDSEADQLVSLNENSGTVLLSSVVRAIGFVLLTVPMLYLFLATKARNPRVQAAMVGFVFVGPILFAAQGVVQAIGADQASSEFVKLQAEEPEDQLAYREFKDDLDANRGKIEKVTIYSADDSLEVEQTNGTFYAVENLPSGAESDLPSELTDIEIETDAETDVGPPDALAAHVTDENGAVQVSQGLLFPSVLGLIVLMVYLPLQALRAGLLTRFLGSIGIALGASMILILPVAVLAMLAWTAFLGLLFVGRVPGGPPPAWDAGEAIPWPRPGEEQASPRRGGDDAIEGDATEVDGEGSSEGDQPSSGPQKRKRKRRS